MQTREPQEVIQRLMRARKVLAGLDEQGNPSHPRQGDPDVISFADGEGNRRPHPWVIAQGMGSLLDTHIASLEKYFFGLRYAELEERIRDTFVQEGIQASAADNLLIASGTAKIFNAFLNRMSSPGDVFVTAAGFYHSLAGWCDIHGVELQVVQTRQENDFKIDRDGLEAWLLRWQEAGRIPPRGLILFNPTYTGALYTEEELSDLADFLADHEMVALEDSIFLHTLFEPDEPVAHLANFPNGAERAVTLNGGSKAYNLANMRIGWACGPKEMIERMSYYCSVTQGTIPHISKVMALAAMNAPEGYLEGNRREFKLRTELVIECVERANAQIAEALGYRSEVPLLEVAHVPKTGHSILLNFHGMRGLEMEDGRKIEDSIDLVRFFLQEAKVCLSPGYSIGFDDLKARIAFGCVGLKHTYEEVGQAEISYLFEELLNRTHVDLTLEELLPQLGEGFREAAERYADESNSGFARGRELLREGILERMVPAIIRIMRRSRTAAHA